MGRALDLGSEEPGLEFSSAIDYCDFGLVPEFQNQLSAGSDTRATSQDIFW